MRQMPILFESEFDGHTGQFPVNIAEANESDERFYSNQIEEMLEDSTLRTIVVPYSEGIRHKQIFSTLNTCVKKLRIGGQITVNGVSASRVAHFIKCCTIRDINEAVFESGIVGLYEATYIRDILQQSGCKIETMSMNDRYFTVTGKRI